MIQLIPKIDEKLNKNQIDEIYKYIKLNKKTKIKV